MFEITFILSMFLGPLLLIGFIATIVYLIVRRIDIEQTEDFEKRDH